MSFSEDKISKKVKLDLRTISYLIILSNLNTIFKNKIILLKQKNKNVLPKYKTIDSFDNNNFTQTFFMNKYRSKK